MKWVPWRWEWSWKESSKASAQSKQLLRATSLPWPSVQTSKSLPGPRLGTCHQADAAQSALRPALKSLSQVVSMWSIPSGAVSTLRNLHLNHPNCIIWFCNSCWQSPCHYNAIFVQSMSPHPFSTIGLCIPRLSVFPALWFHPGQPTSAQQAHAVTTGFCT